MLVNLNYNKEKEEEEEEEEEELCVILPYKTTTIRTYVCLQTTSIIVQVLTRAFFSLVSTFSAV